MRKNILVAGIILFAVAVLFGTSYPDGMVFSIPISILNIILGLITKTPPGPDLQPKIPNIRLVVDRGVVRASVYELVFLDSKLILKRLSSVMVTVVLALLLAVVGLALLFIIGALMGGITGFSLQEYLTQRARDRIGAEDKLAQTDKNDIEINYDAPREVRLVRSRLYLTMENITLVVGFPRGYSTKLEPQLRDIFRSRFVTGQSLRAGKASQK